MQTFATTHEPNLKINAWLCLTRRLLPDLIICSHKPSVSSHTRARTKTLTHFHRELYSKSAFDASPVCAQPVFPLCKKKEIGDLVYPQTLFVGFSCVRSVNPFKPCNR